MTTYTDHQSSVKKNYFMSQDFAKKQNSGKRKKSTTRKPSHSATRVQTLSDSHWSWFLTGLMSGLFTAFIVYLALINPNKVDDIPTVSSIEAPEDESKERDDFDFYESLPAAEVRVDVIPVAERAAPKQDTVNYLVQAGSFPDRQAANSRRANVILLNLNATVVPGVVAGKTWYRVQVGPFIGRPAAYVAINALEDNNIETKLLVAR